MLRTTLIGAAALTAALAAAAADPAPSTVTVYDGLASFELPGGWREIPEQQLEEATMWAAEATAGRVVEVYQHGFRPASADDAGLPRLVVQVRESGRMRSGPFRELPPLEALREHTHDAFPSAVPPLIVGLELESVQFDPDRFVLRLEHRLDLRIRGEVRVLTAAFLTERGWFTLHLSERAKRIDAARSLFDRIVASVHLDPEIAYRPRLSDRWPGWPFFAAAAVTAAALAAWLVRRRRRSA